MPLESQLSQSQDTNSVVRIGRPRLDTYQRLIHRFYESLILLKIMAPAQRSHLSIVEDSFGLQFVRRRFLRNLAFVCDFNKGGDTTTAIALEERYDMFNLWVGCNTDPAKNITPFLKSVLSHLKETLHLRGTERAPAELAFLHNCIDFARKRVVKEGRLLKNAVKRCRGYPGEDDQQSHPDLVEWLRQFEVPHDHVSLCQLAYEVRDSTQMRELEQASWTPMASTGHDGAADGFSSAKHYIGRLAHHVRAPKQLLEDSRRLEKLFDSYDVCPIPVVRSEAPPTRDSHTTLDGILRRMLAVGDDRFPDLREALSVMDQNFGIFDKVLSYYEDGKLRPQVHAEIHVLEHFFKHKLSFMDEDRYIGCSKPTCICCKLYMRYHPARCVESESHQKVYTNWGLPNLPGRQQDPGFVQQRDIIINLSHQLRDNVIEAVLQRRISRVRRADSLTGITSSMVVPVESISGGSESWSEDEVTLDSDDEVTSEESQRNSGVLV